MKIALYALGERGGELPQKVANARSSWSRRLGLHLQVRSDGGLTGHGEASPLPGYSPESLQDARRAIDGALGGRGVDLEPSAAVLSQVEALVASIPPTVPSARFAVETALLDLVGKATGAPLDRLLGREPHAVAWAGMIESSQGAEGLRRAGELVDSGVRTLKVKVSGGAAWADVMPFLRALRERCGRDARVRLDANRSLGPAGLASQLQALASVQPEFIEEPVAPSALAGRHPAPLPLGLDETLHGADAEQQIAWRVGPEAVGPRYEYVVLKPTVLGGLLRCVRLARLARARGARVIVSHTLEGPIAWSACAALAVTVGDTEAAAGLEPHIGLRAWPAVELPSLRGVQIAPHDRPGLGLDEVAWA